MQLLVETFQAGAAALALPFLDKLCIMVVLKPASCDTCRSWALADGTEHGSLLEGSCAIEPCFPFQADEGDCVLRYMSGAPVPIKPEAAIRRQYSLDRHWPFRRVSQHTVLRCMSAPSFCYTCAFKPWYALDCWRNRIHRTIHHKKAWLILG